MPWIQFFVVVLSLQATIISGQTASSESGSTLVPCNKVQILQGRDGATGRDGRDGLVGPPGFPGHNGEKGKHGEVGDAGPRGLPGRTGSMGRDCRPGTLPSTPTGGVTYTRWGASSCRTAASTLYGGRTGATYAVHKGGASNYLCMPNDPQYTLSYHSGVQGHSYVFGVEYEGPPVVSNRIQHNAPCAVCYITSKMTVLMIPAKTGCPTGWTREYYGYLMSAHVSSNHRTEYVCVDQLMESIPGSQIGVAGGHFYHVEAHCNGMACPPYNNYKELTCVVCTK